MAILRAHLAPRPTFLARLNYGDNTSINQDVIFAYRGHHKELMGVGLQQNHFLEVLMQFIIFSYSKQVKS
jgi:hypothetical protein